MANNLDGVDITQLLNAPDQPVNPPIEKQVNTDAPVPDPDKVDPPEGEKPKEADSSEEVELKLDADGNLVDEAGKVVHEKGKFTIKENGEVEVPSTGFVKDLESWAKSKGFELKDDNGQPLVFEDTVEGYQALTEAVAVEQAILHLESMLDEKPGVRAYYEHLAAGKPEEEFWKQKAEKADYAALKIETPLQQEQVLRQKFERIYGMKGDQLDKIVKLTIDSGDGPLEAKEALAELAAWQSANEAKIQAENQAAIVAQQEAKRAQVAAIAQTVDKGEIGGIKIPDNQKAAFKSFLLDADQSGQTKAAAKYAAMPLDQRLMLEYLIMVDLDLAKLVKIEANQRQVDFIKARAQQKVIRVSNASVPRSTGSLDLTTVQ
jgi:hypothetical protein